MSVELLQSHTLLDLHRVLVEQARDDLWTKLGDVQGEGARDESKSDDFSCADAGFFFIEDTFYVSGTKAVEYVKPILAWLTGKEMEDVDDDDTSRSTAGLDRLARLGVSVASVDDLKIVQMSETRLEDLPLRLGVRYAHVHHGNVECSVYGVDRRVQIVRSFDDVASWSRLYPILHDVWTTPYATPTCEACQHRTAALVTTPTCEVTDGGPRPLCRSCARLLQVPASELEVYSIYRGG
jgi:snRNA-activating protein complex (SNAPc), subunit 3